MRVDLSGQVALVTGAGKGIGQAIADKLAANGATVFYTDVQEDNAAKAAAKGGGHALKLDVTDSGEIAGVMDAIMARCGRLDIVVNNAGINTLVHRVTTDQFPREEWDRIVAVDLTAVYEVSKAAAQIGQGRCGLWHGSTIIVLYLFFYRTLPAGRRVESSSRPHAPARG